MPCFTDEAFSALNLVFLLTWKIPETGRISGKATVQAWYYTLEKLLKEDLHGSSGYLRQ